MLRATPRDDLISLNLQNISDDEEEDDLVTFHLSSGNIQITFNHLCKYSRLIQSEYRNKTSIQEIIQKIEQKITKYRINDENVKKLFKVFNDEHVEITSDEYNDFCKLAEIFTVKALKKLLKKTTQKFSENVHFLLNLLINRNSDSNLNEADELFQIDSISDDAENVLSKQINKCLKNEKFGELPISMIYRIIEKSDRKVIESDSLFDFITASIEERCSLFQFIDLKNLSLLKIEKLSQSNMSQFYVFVTHDFKYLAELIRKLKRLETEKEELKKDKKKLEIEKDELTKDKKKHEHAINELQTEISELKETNCQQQNQLRRIEEENDKNKQLNQKLQEETNTHKSSAKFAKEFSGDNFDGIFNELTHQYNGNIHDKGVINISGNVDSISPPISTIVDFNYTDQSYYSKNEPNSFVCFNFKNNSVSLSAYSFKVSNQKGPIHPVSWVLEGSNDSNNWIELDSHSHYSQFKSESQVVLFPIQDQIKRSSKFNFIRFKMIDKSNIDDYILDIANIELFGSYY